MPGTGLLARRRGRPARTAFILALSMTMTVTALPAPAFAVPGPGMSRGSIDLPEIPEVEQIAPDEQAVTDLLTDEPEPLDPYEPSAVDAWDEGSGTVDLTGVAAGEALPVDDLPVALGVPEGGDPAALAGTWAVDLAAPEASHDVGVAGLIMKITPPATADPTAEVALSVDYTPFADFYGPQAADRFGVVLLPDCVFDDPDGGDCADGGAGVQSTDPTGVTGQVVSSEVELLPVAGESARSAAIAGVDEGSPTRRIVTGSVPVGSLVGTDSAVAGRSAFGAQSSATDANVVGVLDTGASASGDFTATPLLFSGSWAAGSSSGAFTYSYQVQVPETAGGLMPKVALSYSSQSVDGRTSATNNQASWIGDGWDYAAGAITRTYVNCRQDSKKPGSNNSEHRTADLCWGSKNATLSLGGMTTELVRDDSTGTWTTANGDGSKVQLLKDTDLANGDADGEYWVVTTRDGTRYHFGRHRLPGWTAGQPVTNSVLTAPVYGNHSGEDCYQAGDWADSACTQAWRWSLDYVEDIHGNVMSLWWAKEENRYARNFNFKSPVKYDRGGYLTRIDYGQRSDNVYGTAPLARVSFDVAERCFAEGSQTCSESNFNSQIPHDYRIWYDTPADLNCISGRKCWNASPSFFTRKRLDKITTWAQRRSGSTALQKVDEYQLTQSFPTLLTGPNTALWLESIQRTGYGVGGDKVALNPVRFAHNPEDMPNRVRNDNRPSFSRLRIARVINEYGGETVVTYRQPTGSCANGSGLPGKNDTAELKANTRLCFPNFWHPDPAKDDVIDWFHKYVVESVEELPAIDGAASSTLTTYAYDNAGWRLAEAEFSKKSRRTYSQFAGFEQVTVLTGPPTAELGSEQTKSVTRYFRGMGDSVSVKDNVGTGDEIAKDREPFAGRVAEELTYAKASDPDANWLTRSVTYPTATELASRDRDDGLDPLKAWRVTDTRQKAVSRSSGTGDDTRTLRTVETKTTYESTHGLPERIESLGDTGKSGDESCTFVEYVHSTTKHIIGLTRQIRSSPTTCAAADFDDLTTLSSAGRVGYDGTAYGAALPSTTRGLATQTWSLKADGSGFQNDGTTTFDAVGRVLTRTDPDNKVSKITYTPATGQAYAVSEENSLGHKQTRELDPGRAVTLKTTDPNNQVSHAEYDALGRLVKAWGAGRTPSPALVPDFRAEYALPAIVPDPENPGESIRKPPYVTTFARGHEDRIQTSVTIYDGLGRERQSQVEATGGGRLITDTLYNSAGEVWQTNNAYFAEGSPIGRLFTPESDTVVPNATRYTYDGLGRVVEELPLLNGTEYPSRATKYNYGLDHSTVINPAGAASYRLYTDGVGRTTRVDTFRDAARTDFTSMRYEYDARGQLAEATHSANPVPWTWTYDQRGRLTRTTDPDTGATTMTYDHRDRPLTSTNARGITVWNGYDELSRPTQQRLGGSGGTLLAQYTYDTVAGGKGLPATSTRYTDGLPYTQSVGGYTADYQPTSTTLTLPESIATTWGLNREYRYDYTYTDTGLTESATLPAVGALPSEKLLVRYTKDGLPLSVSGKDWYGSETVYSPYGQVLRSTLGAHPYRVWTMASYDDASGALTRQQVFREVKGNHLVSNRGYWYDAAGNVTAIREYAAGIAERQCFTYDPLGQLRNAWTSQDQASCQAGPGTAAAPNAAAGVDGTGYWQEYEYDLLGNRSKLVERDLTGRTSTGPIETTYGYGYETEEGDQPRTLDAVTKTYTTPQGAAIVSEAKRLYELTGETKSVTSTRNGDQQELSWTYDGQVERITGSGTKGRTAYMGLAAKCMDLSQRLAQPNQPIQLYSCNGGAWQKWAFTPTPSQNNGNLGTLSVYDDKWCAQPAGTTAGSVLRLQACDGTAGQQFERLPSTAQLKHAASGLCLAAKDGASADNTPIVLVTCASGSAAQQWNPQDETRHIYGPGGTRLLTVQGRQATLNLGEAQLTVHPGGSPIDAQRTYSTPGGAVLRQFVGTAQQPLTVVASDHQGSPYAEVNLSGVMEARIRKQDPFGNVRTGAVSGYLRTNQGFLGAVRDDASGFVPLGARLYDPEVGRFLSADPVLDLTDPVQNNGFTYAHNNPVTHSDPSGLSVALTASETAAALAGAGLSSAMIAQAQANMGRSLISVILDSAWYILKEFIGINDALNCFGGDMWACGSLILNAIPWTKVAKIPAVIRAVNRTINAIQAWQAAKRAAEAVLAAARAAEAAALQAKKLAIERAKKAAQAAKKKAADKVNSTSNKATQSAKKTGNGPQKEAQAKSNPKGSSAASGGASGKGGGGGKGDSKPGGSSGASNRSSGGSSGNNGGSSGGESCERLGNSFVPGTRVLMADGSTKAIEDVEPGDKVVVTDPETGRTEVDTVTAAITGDGVKHLVKVVIDTDGDQGSETAEVTATDGHPFWVPELGEWIDATDLQSGQWLQTSAGTYVQITAIDRWSVPRATVHNLTVANTHTYYVTAGNTPVLVHNCNNVLSNADGYDNSGALAAHDPGAAFSGVYDPDTGVFRAQLSVDERGPNSPANAVNRRGGHGEINLMSFGGSRRTVGFTLFFEEDGFSVHWLSRGVNGRNHGDPMAPMDARQGIMDAISAATGRSVRSR